VCAHELRKRGHVPGRGRRRQRKRVQCLRAVRVRAGWAAPHWAGRRQRSAKPSLL
jgi:hypothetical protein